MSPRSLCFLLASCLLLSPMSALGSPFTITVSGTIEFIEDPSNWLADSLVVGSSWHASFTLDTALSDNLPDDSSVGFYTAQFSPFGAVGQVGNVSLVDNGAELVLSDNVPILELGEITQRDILSLRFRRLTIPGVSCVVEGPTSGSCHTFSISLEDPTASALGSDQMPLSYPELSAWSKGSMTMGMLTLPVSHPQFLRVRGSVDQFTVVPEPSTAILLTVGLTAFAYRRRGVRFSGLPARSRSARDSC